LANKSLTNASTASSDDCVASSSSDASFCSDIAGSREKLSVTAPAGSSMGLPATTSVSSSLPASSIVTPSPPSLRKASSSTASPTCSPSHCARSQYSKYCVGCILTCFSIVTVTEALVLRPY